MLPKKWRRNENGVVLKVGNQCVNYCEVQRRYKALRPLLVRLEVQSRPQRFSCSTLPDSNWFNCIFVYIGCHTLVTTGASAESKSLTVILH